MTRLLLLHGALGSKEQLNPLREVLKDHFEVYSLSFSGHGGREFADGPFSMELFSNDVLEFLNEHHLDHTNIFGYSMGGYVALYLARFHPGKVKKVITLATKFNWTPETAAKEAALLNPEVMEQKIPGFVQTLQLRHGSDKWREVVTQTAAMMIDLGNKNPLLENDFVEINNPVTLMLGDGDKMVSMEESKNIQNLLPNGNFEIIPDTAHPIEKVDVDLLAKKILAKLV